MRYTLKANIIANTCAERVLGKYECFSALYVGKLGRFPDTLIFYPIFQSNYPKLGLPPFILVHNNEAKLVLDMGILIALKEKYGWQKDFCRGDGWTPPTQVKRFYMVKGKAERKARKILNSKNELSYGPFLWEEEKRILREEYHINWWPESEIYFDRIY